MAQHNCRFFPGSSCSCYIYQRSGYLKSFAEHSWRCFCDDSRWSLKTDHQWGWLLHKSRGRVLWITCPHCLAPNWSHLPPPLVVVAHIPVSVYRSSNCCTASACWLFLLTSWQYTSLASHCAPSGTSVGVHLPNTPTIATTLVRSHLTVLWRHGSTSRAPATRTSSSAQSIFSPSRTGGISTTWWWDTVAGLVRIITTPTLCR